MTYLDEFGNEPLEGFYGGAAGGGKSESLLTGSAQYVEIPGYAALMLRKTYGDLAQPGAIMDRASDWWRPTAARWIDDTKTWRFPSGATVSFGYLEHEKDKYRYAGSEYQYIGFDELTQFSETSYLFLGSRLRKTIDLPVPLRRRSASNPGGIGHEWVRTRFVNPGHPGTFFVPAGLDDNPSLDREQYRIMLQELDPVTRAQLLRGDWDIAGGGAVFDRAWFKIEDKAPSEFQRLVRYWDTAATGPSEGKKADYTVGTLAGLDVDGDVWILDVVRFQGTPHQVEKTIRHQADDDGWQVEVCIEQEPGASGKQVIEHYQLGVLNQYSAKGVRVTGKKEVRAAPYSIYCRAGRIHLLRGEWILAFQQEHEAFPFGGYDDQVDSATGAVTELIQGEDLRPADPGLEQLFSRL